MKDKLYTLQEAYEVILGIKKDNGIPEYQDAELRRAFANGYAKALNDQQEAFQKIVDRLASINQAL